MIDYLHDAATNRLGMGLLIAAAVAVLVVDIARELTADDVDSAGARRARRWIAWTAFAVVPILIVGAAVATVVRVFTLA